jgi:hypothetical protein
VIIFLFAPSFPTIKQATNLHLLQVVYMSELIIVPTTWIFVVRTQTRSAVLIWGARLINLHHKLRLDSVLQRLCELNRSTRSNGSTQVDDWLIDTWTYKIRVCNILMSHVEYKIRTGCCVQTRFRYDSLYITVRTLVGNQQ